VTESRFRVQTSGMSASSTAPRRAFPLLPLGIAAVGFAVSLALLLYAWNLRRVTRDYGVTELPRLGEVPDFGATTERGASVRRADLDGKVLIADFIFTTCTGICPGMTAKMKSLVERLRDEPRIRFVSFTVDPEHDTPEVLLRYAREHGADGARWSFLRIEKAGLRRLAREGFKLAVEDGGAGAAEPILHSTRFVLVDAAGLIRGYYDSDEPGAMAALASDARRLAAGNARSR
jgi:protein SCO1/2